MRPSEGRELGPALLERSGSRSYRGAGRLFAAFVGMKAVCRSLNLNFRIENLTAPHQSVTAA